MLISVTIRREGDRTAHGHISDGESDRVFCGITIPAAVMECGLSDAANPYVNRVDITCFDCIAEFRSGRTDGFKEVE